MFTEQALIQYFWNCLRRDDRIHLFPVVHTGAGSLADHPRAPAGAIGFHSGSTSAGNPCLNCGSMPHPPLGIDAAADLCGACAVPYS